MSDAILGAGGEQLALRDTLEGTGEASALPRDPTLLRRDLAELARIPGNRDVLYRVVALDPVGPRLPTADRTLVDSVARRLEGCRSTLADPEWTLWWQMPYLPSP